MGSAILFIIILIYFIHQFRQRFISFSMVEYRKIKSQKALSTSPKPCLFLDRDGVIIEDTDYPYRISDLKIYKGIIPIIEWAMIRNWYVIVLTNQAGIAKGIFTLKEFYNFTEELNIQLSAYGVKITKTYYCPYHRDAKNPMYKKDSVERKPQPGMALRAMKDYSIDLAKSIMIGDKESDKLQGIDLHTILIRGRYPIRDRSDYVVVENHQEAFGEIKKRFSLSG